MSEQDNVASTEWIERPRILKCHRDGCDSPAEFHVGLEMQCTGPLRQLLQAPTTLKVCKRHMQSVGPYLMSNANKSRIVSGLMQEGMPLPDFASAAVVFVPIKAAENNWQAAREGGTRH